MIKEIYLENWKSHEKSFITFDKINLIIGRMGSGKTSITDAISYALLGNFSDLNSKKIKLEDIIMKKPKEKDFTKVILKFIFNEKEYEITRIIEKNKGSYAELKENKKIIRSGTTDVNEFIQKLLKIDFHTFINVVYSEQNKMEFFLNLEKGERKSRFDEMIGIERLERIRKSCVSLKNRLSDIHKEKEKILSQLILENLDKKLEEINTEIMNVEKKNLELKRMKDELENSIKELSKKIENGRKIKEEIEYIEKEIIEKKAKYERTKNLIEKLSLEVKNLNEKIIDKEINELKNKIIEIENKINILKQEKEKISNERDELLKKLIEIKEKIKKKNEIEKKLKEISDIERRNEEIELKERELKNFEEKMIKRLKEIESELKKEKDILNILENEFSICPICESEINKEKKEKLKEKHREFYKSLEEEMKKLEEEMKKIKKECEILEKTKNEILTKILEKKNLSNELEKLKEVNDEKLKFIEEKFLNVENKIKEFEVELNYLRNEKNNFEIKIKEKEYEQEKIKKINELENEIKEFKKKINFLENMLNDLKEKEDFKNLKIYEEFLKRYEIELEKIKNEIENNKKLISILNQRKKEIEERILNREKLRKEKEYLERVIKDLNILEICTKESQIIVRNKLIDAINYYLSLYWKKIYPYRDYIDARFVATEDDYILQIKDSLGRWIDLDKIASGGERTLAAICLRIAFSKVLSPLLNIIIFDEPTHNLDNEAIIQFAKIINESFPEIFDQVFIITHDERFKSIINANVIKVERDKFEDLPSKIIIEQ